MGLAAKLLDRAARARGAKDPKPNLPRKHVMPLSAADRAELDRLGLENVRLKLAYAGAGPVLSFPDLGRALE